MTTTLATFAARNEDGDRTTIRVQMSLSGNRYPESDDLGMGQKYPASMTVNAIAADLARRHGYTLFDDSNPKRTTFKEFVDSRTEREDIQDHCDMGCVDSEPLPGYTYLNDSFYIYTVMRESTDREGNEQFDPDYIVTIGNSEYAFGDDLEAAEKYLWDEFALLETNHWLRSVAFGWDDETTYEGFTDGSTWNGWHNIWVTEKVHNQILEEFDATLPTGLRNELKELLALPRTEEIEDQIHDLNSFHLVEQDDDRLFSYAYGYATCIEE